MAAAGASLLVLTPTTTTTRLSPVFRWEMTTTTSPSPTTTSRPIATCASRGRKTRALAVHRPALSPAEQDPNAAIDLASTPPVNSPPQIAGSSNGSLTRISEGLSNGSLARKKDSDSAAELATTVARDAEEDDVSGSISDYFEQSKVFIRSDSSGCGPPRWFTPLDCGGDRLKNAPLLLYLPGIDGVGLGLVRHHRKLGKMFDTWCLHIPVRDRTSFTDLVKLVEDTVKSEYQCSPGRPIYLVGESLGGCLALVVAARNPDVDLVLILANPATSISGSPLQQLAPLLGFIPSDAVLTVPYLQSLLQGMLMGTFLKALMGPQAVEDLSRSLLALSSYFPVMVEILPRDTIFWKMDLLKVASCQANSRLHAVKAETMILASGRDLLLPSSVEGERIRRLVPKCDIRKFNDNGHFLFLEDGVDVVCTIKASNFYRRGRFRDHIADYVPPTPSEFKRMSENYRLFEAVTSPVMFSTLENGQIVRGLAGLPSEGPVILVGYHMLMGFELAPLVTRILKEKNILVRGMAHPMMFIKPGEWKQLDSAMFDTFRLMGAVPVTGTNFFKLLSSKSHVLLYPGGVREALHRKGEKYQLFWPERSEVVRMAARFGAKIVPFGAVGEDDISEIVLDYNDLARLPYFGDQIREITNETVRLRTDATGEVANQDLYLPGIVPKPPGRLYYLFGKPIKTSGRKKELNDREKAQELYLHVKSEVERCLAYLKQKRENDPYRNILPRTLYQVVNGTNSEIPSFDP